MPSGFFPCCSLRCCPIADHLCSSRTHYLIIKILFILYLVYVVIRLFSLVTPYLVCHYSLIYCLFLFLFRYLLKSGHLPFKMSFSATPYSPELEYPTALVLSLKETAHECDLESLERVCFQSRIYYNNIHRLLMHIIMWLWLVADITRALIG